MAWVMITLETSVCQSRSPGVFLVTVPGAEFCGASGRALPLEFDPYIGLSRRMHVGRQCKFPLLGFPFRRKIVGFTDLVEFLLGDMGQSVVAYAILLHSSRALAKGIHFRKDQISKMHDLIFGVFSQLRSMCVHIGLLSLHGILIQNGPLKLQWRRGSGFGSSALVAESECVGGGQT